MQKHSDHEILSRLGIEQLNEMQETAYKTIATTKDTLLLAPTGSGKTLGFLLPVLKGLSNTKTGVQTLVLVPSRELALQIEQVWKKMSTGFKVNSCYGGHLLETEINNLATPPALLIGTPGRIADHIRRGSFAPNDVTTLVLDEFDKSLALGFEEEMSFIISELKKLTKKVLVSATTAIEIPEFTGVIDPKVLDFISEKSISSDLDIKLVHSPQKDKVDILTRLLSHIGAESAIIFCNHREAVERTGKLLAENGIENIVFHGGMEQMEREQALARFRNGSVHFLVATDLAARGLDIPQVKHVIHYHTPSTAEEFTHRNGRTARMNAKGTAYLILHEEEHIPKYLESDPDEMVLSANRPLPPVSDWATIYISGGKKDKLNKVDIVGFFCKTGGLQKDEIGLIDVKDHLSFVAVSKKKTKELLSKVQDQKMKGKKYRVAIAR